MAEEKTLYVDIISPEKPVYSGKAGSLTAMAWDGEVGIFPGHAPMVTRLGIGEVRVSSGSGADKKVSRFAIKQGYLEVSHNKVVVLSEDAKAISDLKGIKPEDFARLEKAIAEASDPLRKAELQADLAWLRSCDKLLKGV